MEDDLDDPAIASVLKDEIERKTKKARFGDNKGRLGRRHKGAGKHFDEEAARFNDDGDEDDGSDEEMGGTSKRKRAESSMKTGRNIKDVENAGEDWEHDEDSEEESERRQYENESGYRVEPFNTDMEREEGRFDDSTGHYIEDRFKVSQRDAWLEEVQDKYAHGLVAKVQRQKRKAEEDEPEEKVDKVELLKLLHASVHEGENLAKAMRRIKGGKGVEGGDAALFDKLTDAADKLLSQGYHNVFSDSKTQIAGRLAATQQQAREKEGAATKAQQLQELMAFDDQRQWEYRFPKEEFKAVDLKAMSTKELKGYLDGEGVAYDGIVDKDDLFAKARQTQDRKRNQMEQTHGPFTTGNMRAWNMQGYFAPPRTVLVRQVGTEEFYSTDRIDLDDMLA